MFARETTRRLSPGEICVGRVVKWIGNGCPPYGFAAVPNSTADVLLPGYELYGRTRLRVGDLVKFTIRQDHYGRLRAARIYLVANGM